MVRLTVQETWTLFFPVLATLLIMVIYGIVHFTTSYGFAYAPKYEKTEVVIGNGTGKIPSTPTPLKATTNTQLRTYTDPTGFFTLQYPANWTVEYKQPVTKFDKPKVNFAPYGGGSVVTIAVKPSLYSSPEDFRGTVSLLPSYFAAFYPTVTIFGNGFGVYSIAGYDTYAFTYRNNGNPVRPLNGMLLMSRIGYQDMSIAFNADLNEFDKQMPLVQKMIDSIKITGLR